MIVRKYSKSTPNLDDFIEALFNIALLPLHILGELLDFYEKKLIGTEERWESIPGEKTTETENIRRHAISSPSWEATINGSVVKKSNKAVDSVVYRLDGKRYFAKKSAAESRVLSDSKDSIRKALAQYILEIEKYLKRIQVDTDRLISKCKEALEVRTLSYSDNTETASKRLWFEYWLWNSGNFPVDRYVDGIIRDLVDGEINSKVEQYRLVLLDIDTHRPIENASIIAEIEPGINFSVLDRLLTHTGQDKVKEFISEYARKNIQKEKTDGNGVVRIRADTAARLLLKVNIDGYHRVSEIIDNIGHRKKTFERMSLSLSDDSIGVLVPRLGSKSQTRIIN